MPESLSLDDLIPTGGAVVTKIGKTNIVMANDRGILKIYTPVENSIIEVEIAKTLDNIIKRVDNWMKLEKAIESSARTFESMGRERAMERIKDEESKKG
jgi:coenzyme F420-reducing hydrogenase beta subunit